MVEVAGSQCGDTARQLEGLGVRELERRRVVERRRFALDRDNDLLTVVPGIGAPEARRAIDELAPVAGAVMHILGADNEPRPFLECAIGRERHPVGFEVIGDSDFCLCLCPGLSPFIRRHARPCCRASTSTLPHKDVDARDKPGHDRLQRCWNARVWYVDQRWPINQTSQPSSKPACHAALPTVDRPKSPRPGTWSRRSGPCSSAMALTR